MYARPDGDDTSGDTNSNDGRFRTRGENRSDRRWLDTGRIANIEDYEVLGFEALLNIGSFQAVGEWQSNWSHRDGGEDLNFQGGYVMLSYFLTGEHQPYNRQQGIIGRVKPFENFFLVDRCDGSWGRGLGAWQIAARYSYLDLSDEDILGGEGSNFTFGVNWHWTAYSRVQFNYIYGDIRNHENVAGFTSGSYNVLGARFMVDFNGGERGQEITSQRSSITKPIKPVNHFRRHTMRGTHLVYRLTLVLILSSVPVFAVNAAHTAGLAPSAARRVTPR